MSDDLDDFEWFMELSEEEQNAEVRKVEAQWRQHCERLARLPIPQQVAIERQSWLRLIRDNRRRLRDPKLARVEVIDETWRETIRRAQVHLLKLRIWRATGTYPGEG